MPHLTDGSRGTEVEKLQRTLNDRLALNPKLAVDGVFGKKTREAVWVYQSRAGLKADGIVGPETQTALTRSFFPAPGKRTFNRTAAVAYARKHAPMGQYNPDYPQLGNDCANFVSQAMYAGGWTMVWATLSGLFSSGDENYLNRKSTAVWWHTPITRVRSFSWGGAPELIAFMTGSGRGKAVTDPKVMTPGDVVGFWGRAEGKYKHVMVVTKAAGGELYLSGHTNDLLDEPLSAIMKRNAHQWDRHLFQTADSF